MSAVAQAIYLDTTVAAFETRQSVLREAVTTQTESRGGSVFFLVVGSGNVVAVTRGSNGLIPAVDDSQTQVQVTFAASHHKVVRNGFDIFKAQGNQLEIMRNEGIWVINRKIDAVIIAAAETGTVSLGAIGAMNKNTANIIATKLRNAHAGEDMAGNLYALLTPAAWAYMSDITSFGNTQYSNTGGHMENGIPLMGPWKYWMGINWGEHTGLTGTGTSTATCLAWHKAAIGHAISSDGIKTDIGPDPGEDRSYALHSLYHGAAKLQNAGIVKFTHDDSGLS